MNSSRPWRSLLGTEDNLHDATRQGRVGGGFVIQVLPAHPQSEEKLLLAAGEREGPKEWAGPRWPEDKVGEDRGVRCPLGLASSAAEPTPLQDGP